MAITPTTATTENTPERMSSGFQRTVIGLYSFGSRCRAARHGRLRAAGPSGPSGVPSIRGVENRQEILGNDHGNHVRKVRERPGTGGSAQASERRCEWEGATPFALIPRRGRIPLPLNPRIRAPHTIRYSPPGHQAQYSRDAREAREFTSHRERIDPGAARTTTQAPCARESCLPFSDKLGTPWLFENGGSVADKMRPIEFQRSLVLCRFIFLKSMPRTELVTAFPARQGVNMLRKATFK